VPDLNFFKLKSLDLNEFNPKRKSIKSVKNMMKKKIFVFSISLFLFLGVIVSANAYHEYITTWEGPAHEHCGHDASNPSVTGSLVLTVNETGTLEPYQVFEITIEVLNFTEALEDPYHGKIMIGIPGVGEEGVDIDNHLFSSPLGEHILNRRESIDDWGSYDESMGTRSDTDCLFKLLAPNKAGTYTLMALAIAAVNQSGVFADTVEHADMNITYIEETVTIVVVAAPEIDDGGNGGTIPGFITIVLLSSVGVTIISVVLAVRRKKRIVE